jgi:hypothetical protein
MELADQHNQISRARQRLLWGANAIVHNEVVVRVPLDIVRTGVLDLEDCGATVGWSSCVTQRGGKPVV